jgi:hypothetical protein
LLLVCNLSATGAKERLPDGLMGGVASITPLAAYDENEICDTCERVFAAKAGGPAAAIEEALLYVDAYHEGSSLRRVHSEIRRLPARTDS